MNPDELLIIAMKLDLPSLLNWCQTNKRINEIICKRDPVWLYRLNQDFPDWKEFVLTPKETPFTESKPIDIYKYLYKLKKGKDMLEVEGSLLDYSKLTSFISCHDNIKEIPETLPQNLQELDLYNNNIKEIPETLPQNLQVLRLSYNSISEIPETLPPNLQQLWLSRNLISEIPEILPPNLQILDLSRNFIKEIPETLLQNLRILDLSGNPLIKKVVIPGVRIYQ
jgi:hypothetical protein